VARSRSLYRNESDSWAPLVPHVSPILMRDGSAECDDTFGKCVPAPQSRANYFQPTQCPFLPVTISHPRELADPVEHFWVISSIQHELLSSGDRLELHSITSGGPPSRFFVVAERTTPGRGSEPRR